MSIAVFNSFSKGAADVVTGTYYWHYYYQANTQQEDYGYGEAARGIAYITQPNVRKYKLLTFTAGQSGFEYYGGSSGYPYFVTASILIETDVLAPHPTIKIEGANNTVTTITTSPSDWTYGSGPYWTYGSDGRSLTYRFADGPYWKYEFKYVNDAAGNPDDGFRDIFGSFTGETWAQWKLSGLPGQPAPDYRADDDDHPGAVAAGAITIGETYYITSTGLTSNPYGPYGLTDFTLIGAADNNSGTEFVATGTGLVTAGSFVNGESYTITDPGNTYFTAVGASNNNQGTTFTATGAGSGSGTATQGTGAARVFGSAITVTLSDP